MYQMKSCQCFLLVCQHVLRITWTCQNIFQCKPFHKPHQDPAPRSRWPHQQIAASETHTQTHTHTHTVKRYQKTVGTLVAFHEMIPEVWYSMTAYWGWVALQGRVNLAQTEQLALLQETRFNPHGVQGRSSMPLWDKQLQIQVGFVKIKNKNSKVRRGKGQILHVI